jgi:L-ascorbate metabolism protein UlaG (beta-lactamase superfamily)
MIIEQIRNATLRIAYAGKNFLVDPWLAPEGALGSFADIKVQRPSDPSKLHIKMPVCGLPKPVNEITAGIDAYLLTHLHPDHFDMDMATGTGGKYLDKDVPIYVQNEEEAAFMRNSGFTAVSVFSDGPSLIGGARITKTFALHGTETPCGPASGLIFQCENEKTLYIAGDTVWCPEVKNTLETYRPDVIVLNACAAELVGYGRLIMDDGDAAAVCQTCPDAVVIASHMETVSHAALTRKTLAEKLAARGLCDRVLIPADGEIMKF